MQKEIEEALKHTFVSVLKYTSYFNQRTLFFKKSIESLVGTTKDTGCKIILIDNGEEEDEEYCLNLIHEKKIHAYLRFHNVGLVARNIGFDVGRELVPNAQFIVLSDDDLLFSKGWLEESLGILIKYPDKKIVSTPIHSRCHMSSRYSRGKLPDGHMLNKRAGANCRVYRIKDMLEIGRFHRREPNAEFFVNGVEYTNRFSRMGYLSALTFKPMARDISINPREPRHAYPGDKGKGVVGIIKEECSLDPKIGISVGNDDQKVCGKHTLGEISSYMLYNFKNLFLYCTECLDKTLKLTTRLYKTRFKNIQENEILDKMFDFVFLNTVGQETLGELKEKIELWTTRLNPGGILLCYMGLNRKKFLKPKIVKQIGLELQIQGGYVWKKV